MIGKTGLSVGGRSERGVGQADGVFGELPEFVDKERRNV